MLKNRFFLFLLSGALYASCSGDQAVTNEANSGEQNEPAKLAAAGEIDPVCEMEKDSTWAEIVVNNGDTTWFCSETCKTAYVGNPTKYKK